MLQSKDSVRHEQRPSLSTPFIGRDAELAELRTYFTNPTGRLLTLTGLGGVEAVRSTLVRCRLQPNSEGLLCSCSKRNQ